MSSDDEGSVVARVHFSNHSGSVAQIRICPKDICKIISNGKISESMYIDDWKCRIEKYEILPKKKVFLIHARVAKGDLPKAPRKGYRRGTAVVIRDGRLLLVRERGKSAFSLPGGKARKGEPSLAAATRELAEELGMFPKSATRLFKCDYQVEREQLALRRCGHRGPLSTRFSKAIWHEGALRPSVRSYRAAPRGCFSPF